jgi:hypothetical protein
MSVDREQALLFMRHRLRLPAVAATQEVDFFERARRVAVAVLLAAGAACVIGGVLDWATLERCPEIVPGSNFDESELEDPPPCPVRGVDTTEGKIAIAAGFGTLAAAILLTLKVRGSYAWLALLTSVVAGSFAISAYRGIGDANSSISRRLGLIDAYEPGIGLILVAAAAVIGVLAAVGGIAATPARD